jgi:hypothetical protein
MIGTSRAQIPDPLLSHATCESSTPRSIINVPHGGGDPLNMARMFGSGLMDATITLTLLDSSAMPIVGYPAEDIWLHVPDSGAGDYISCPAGNIADSPTNSSGQTTFSNSMRAGGSGSGSWIMIGTWPTPEFPIYFPGSDLFHFNSPDINGDLQVNLSDIAIFAGDFFGAYNYRSDFFWDGVLNLADIGFLAQGVGASCP